MSRTVTAVKVSALALALASANLSAQETRMRLPSNGESARGAAAQISSRPYAGSWEGTFVFSGRTIPMKVSLTEVAGSLDTYTGETQVATFAAAPNAPISTLGMAMALPRSAGEGTMAAASGPSTTAPAPTPSAPPTIEVLDLSSGTATLASRGARQMMCDGTGRCAQLPMAKWESKGIGGASWIYTATLVAKDKIEGTISVKEGEGEKEIGTFSLARAN